MRNPYLKEMNTFMTLHWKDTLEENGFTPIRDSTEWVRLTDNQIMQIILCSGYTLPEILFYSQTLSEYMWCNYRSQMNMTYYAENHYAHAAWCKQEDPKRCRDVDPRISNDVDLQMQYTLKVLNTIQTPHDILSYRCERELVHPIRPCLWYEAGDIQGTWRVLENVKCPTSYYFQGDVPPEKLKRDYWRVWEPKTAFVARDCLAKGSLQPLADFAEESREFNLKYLKRYMPWLLK